MSRTKQYLTTKPCALCGLLYPMARAELGYDTCKECGEMEARRVRHTVVPMHKSNYIVPANPQELKGINNKGGFFR